MPLSESIERLRRDISAEQTRRVELEQTIAQAVRLAIRSWEGDTTVSEVHVTATGPFPDDEASIDVTVTLSADFPDDGSVAKVVLPLMNGDRTRTARRRRNL